MKKFIAKVIAILCASIIDNGKGTMYHNAENIYRWIMYVEVEDQP